MTIDKTKKEWQGLSKACQRHIYMIYRKGYASIPQLNVTEARKRFSNETVDPSTSKEIHLNCSGKPLKANFFYPKNIQSNKLIIYLHGGGYVFRNLPLNAKFCNQLSESAGAFVLMPHYALSPEHKFPDAIEQMRGLIEKISADSTLIKGKIFNQIFLCGESSGANLATASILGFKKNLMSGLILLSPSLDYSNDHESKKRYDAGMLLDKPIRDWLANHYLNCNEERNNEMVSPLKSENLKNLPQCLILASEFDPLYSETLAFYHKAKKNCDVSFKAYPTIHGFMTLAINPFFDDAIKKIQRFIYPD